MLVLSRGVGEAIVIGDDIVITVIECCGKKVRLGISAPADVRVHRQEVHDKLLAQALARSSPRPPNLPSIAGDSSAISLARS